VTSTAEKTFAVEGIRVPDTRLAREITQFVRDTESALLFHHSSRVYTGVRSPENIVVSSMISSFCMQGRCFTTWA
jgi:hypothetical protein